ncbi:hypothetical protein FJZ18_02900 [Candidatus Pacearchaeota archaeon]|nr:hypothetical protein [Candidatus Pacearchaeota archaeon]
MKLRKCDNHDKKVYTLKQKCPSCNGLSEKAHYKYIRLPDAPKTK